MPTVRFQSTSEPYVSILIAAMARPDTLRACLGALASEAAGEIPCELVIVLDAATPDVRAFVRDEVCGATVLDSPVHLGMTGSLVLARDEARGSILAFAHDDMVVEPGWLETLVATLVASPNTGVVGPCCLGGSDRAKLGAVLWRDGRISDVHDRHAGPEPFPIDVVGTVSMVIRAETYDSIDGVDHRFFPAGYVDVDLCAQVRARGETVLAVPAARIHHHPESTSSHARRVFLAKRNHPRFAEKWSVALQDHVPLDLENLDSGILRALERVRQEAEANAAAPPPPVAMRRPLDRAALERRCLEEGLAFHRDLAIHLEELLEQRQ